MRESGCVDCGYDYALVRVSADCDESDVSAAQDGDARAVGGGEALAFVTVPAALCFVKIAANLGRSICLGLGRPVARAAARVAARTLKQHDAR